MERTRLLEWLAFLATELHKEVFIRAGHAMSQEQGCESILLAGTDLALVFSEASDPGFQFLDCAGVHATAIVQCAARNR